MSEKKETSSTTLSPSKNKVSLSLDDYEDLRSRASRPTETTVNVTRKTDEQNANDNIMYGIVSTIIGGAFSLAGVLLIKYGNRSKK